MRGHLFYDLTNARQMKFIGKIDMIILLWMFRLKIMLGELAVEKYSCYNARGINARHLHRFITYGAVRAFPRNGGIFRFAAAADLFQCKPFDREFPLCPLGGDAAQLFSRGTGRASAWTGLRIIGSCDGLGDQEQMG